MTVAMMAAVVVVALAPPPALLEDVQRQRDPIRRFDMALALARTRMAEARRLVRAGGSRSEMEGRLQDAARAAEIALESLRASGRKPSKLAKQYKRGEIQTRDLERAMEDLAMAVSFDERAVVDEIRKRVGRIHEEFLKGVMTGR